MDWSLRRQILYISVMLLVVVGVLGILFFKLLTAPPTCFDGKQNGEERGIDCGGGCSLICEGDTVDPIVLWQRPVHIVDDLYHVVAYVENPNINAAAQNLKYRFKIYDNENLIIEERTGTTFLAPNGQYAIFEAGIYVGNRIPATAFFEILEKPLWRTTESRFSIEQIHVEDPVLENLEATPRLRTSIRNSTVNEIFDIYVTALLYDAGNNLVSASETYIPSLLQGTVQDIAFTWPQPFSASIARYEIIPSIDVFARGNRR